MICLTVHFSGRVQGVGFRYTAAQIARRYRVAGYVQNMPDGRVRAVAEGNPDVVRAFVDAVCQRMSRCIDTHHIDESAATGEFGAPDALNTFTIQD